MKLGEQIKLLRNEKVMTQPELASKAGIEQSYLSKLENDKAVPSFDIINRVAMALDTTGLDLIITLSQSYIEDNLSHIPEVAAEYAVVKRKQETTLKKRFVLVSMIVVSGVALVLAGSQSIFFPDMAYRYQSDGVIKKGENILQFHRHPVAEINETVEESEQRLKSNRTRFDKVFLLSYVNSGDDFVVDVDGGRRHYYLDESQRETRVGNDIISVFGMILIVLGGFGFVYIFTFKP